METIITTPRLELCRLTPGDLDALYALYSDAATMTFIGDGTTATKEETAEALLQAIEEFELDGYGAMAAVSRTSGQMIGRCGHKRWEVDGKEQIEVGWMIHPDHTGQGLASEAGIALRDHAFEALDLGHVISVIQPGNLASIRVAENVGETYWRDWTTPRGKDVVLYRVDRGRAGTGSLIPSDH